MRLNLHLIPASVLFILVAASCSKKEDTKEDSKQPANDGIESPQKAESQANTGPEDTTTTANPCAAQTNGSKAAKVASAPPTADGLGLRATPIAEPDPASLFARLGGKDAITAVVDDAVANIMADKRINDHFAQADVLKLKGHLVDQVCQLTGGPCTYKGRSAQERYKDRRIGEREFAAVLEAVSKSLAKHKVGASERKELIGALSAMKNDIVGSGK